MKHSRHHLLIALVCLFFLPDVSGQETGITVNTGWDHERHSWKAQWITHPTAPVLDYGVFLFRNEFRLEQVPDSLVVHLSADMRYKLRVNGQMVTTGPAKGSFNYWRYETIDLRPWLTEGDNVLAVEVYNLGIERPAAMFSRQTAFIFQAEHHPGGETGLTTPGNWKVTESKAYAPIPVSGADVGGYYVAGPTDRFDASHYPWGWMKPGFVVSGWKEPKALGKGVGRGYMHGVSWMLVPRQIPLLESGELRFARVARVAGLEVPEGFLEGREPLVIPAGDTVSLLLDQGELTVGYPVLKFTGGPGSTIRLTYAESLRHPDGSKGNRDQTEGKEILGYHDLILPDGGAHRSFQPLWLRTWRYVQVDIVCAEDPLIIHDFYGDFSAYPFREKGSFSSDNPLHEQIWEAGWRTARLCAGETYMDCPYYEQLQYLGDTRIQALISLTVAGDDRLMRNALKQADESRLPGGLTLSRGPSFIPQVIPAFSLYWVDMVHDYYLYRQDDQFLRQFLPGIEAVLGWFERHIDYTGMLGPLDWFNFADWTDGFMAGAPPGADLGHSALISLNYVYALHRAAELFNWFASLENSPGLAFRAQEYLKQAERTRKAVYNLCYDYSRGLLSDLPLDDPTRDELYKNGLYSQHTNIWGILTGAFPEDDVPAVMEKILSDSSLIPTTIYFRFYLFQAMQMAGMADRYTEMLGSWERMLGNGLTTFQEGDYKDRSDCHAWSASPLYHFLSLVAGITLAEPGFRSVNIAPALGPLKHIEAAMPHPAGMIGVQLERRGKEGVKGSITLPEGLHGTLIWNGYSYPLVPGEQEIKQ
ncbi:MAG: family 78 glycoside hydrolase catalytic domain [Bacteroidales bacterium]|nr:family 78 glycoside hydrolase catalytic domain [Bacteroidales bacterium]